MLSYSPCQQLALNRPSTSPVFATNHSTLHFSHQTDNNRIVLLATFQGQRLGTCEASRFDSNSNRTIPIRFKNDGPIQNFRISRTCRRTTNHAYCSTKNFNHCAVVIEIYFMFMILCLCSKSIHTRKHCRSDHTILFEEPGVSAHLCSPVVTIMAVQDGVLGRQFGF